jgi:hypothetical protein
LSVYYKASIAPNPKLLNDFEPSKEQLKTVYGGIMEEVNELRLQIASKKTLSAIDHQGNTLNTNIPLTAMSSQRAPRELPRSSLRAPRDLPSPSLSEICVLISLSRTAEKQSFLGTN